MKHVTAIFLPSILVAMLTIGGCNSTPQPKADPDLSTNLDSVSYSLGYFYGSTLANEGIDEFNYSEFITGLNHAMEHEDSRLDEMEMQLAIQQFQDELMERRTAQQELDAEDHIEEGRQFLSENAERDDVNVTDSGLQYRVIEEGTGASPTDASRVTVHYRGTLIDGEQFDSSYERGDPATFPLNQVINGWTEGLQLMSEGATYEFFIPHELAYGTNPPRGSIIPPGAVLIFEVELIEVVE